MEEKRRRYQRIPRVALQLPKQSAWMRLYSSKDDSALITPTGLDHNAFASLLRGFSDIFDGFSPYSTTGEILKLSNNKKKGGDPDSCLQEIAWDYTLHGHGFVGQLLLSS